MPTRHDVESVARKLRSRLNGHAFQTLPRMEVTKLLREVSGEDATRIKKDLAMQLEGALLKQGVRCYPSLAETSTGDTVRRIGPEFSLVSESVILAMVVALIAVGGPSMERGWVDG